MPTNILWYGTEGTTRRNRFPETTNVVTNIHTNRALLSSIRDYTALERGDCEKISPAPNTDDLSLHIISNRIIPELNQGNNVH